MGSSNSRAASRPALTHSFPSWIHDVNGFDDGMAELMTPKHPTLKNSGQNNCFLNALLQSIVAIKFARTQILSWSPHCHPVIGNVLMAGDPVDCAIAFACTFTGCAPSFTSSMSCAALVAALLFAATGFSSSWKFPAKKHVSAFE